MAERSTFDHRSSEATSPPPSASEKDTAGDVEHREKVHDRNTIEEVNLTLPSKPAVRAD